MLRALTFFAVSLVMLPGMLQAGFQLGFTGPALGYYEGVQAGTNVTETLFIEATGADTLQGLTGFQFDLTSGAGGTTINSFTGAAGFTGSATPIPAVPGPPGFRLNFLSGGFVDVPAVGNRVDLGMVSFNIGPPGSMTPINFTDIPGQEANSFNISGTANGAFMGLDQFVLPGSQVISVPEPSSLALLGSLGLGTVLLRRRRA